MALSESLYSGRFKYLGGQEMPADSSPERLPKTQEGSSVKELAHVANILNSAYLSSLELKAAGRFDNFKDKTEVDLLDAYLNDPDFDRVYSQALIEAELNPDKLDFEKSLRGAMFQDIAVLYLSSLDTGDWQFLGSDVALDVAKVFYPNSKIIDHAYGEKGLDKVSICDGFMLSGGGNIQRFIECSLGSWNNKKRAGNQILGNKIMIEKLGNIVEQPILTIVSPTFNLPPALTYEENSLMISAIDVPVHIDLFMNDFYQAIYTSAEFNQEDGRSLEQIRDYYHK